MSEIRTLTLALPGRARGVFGYGLKSLDH